MGKEERNGTLKRVKERFSVRKKKGDKKDHKKKDQDCIKNAEMKQNDREVKDKNIIQRVKEFFFKKKKKDPKKINVTEEELGKESTIVNEVPKVDLNEHSIHDPDPIPTPTPPSPRPVTPASKPPAAPRAAFLGRPPSSATASQSRPISSLDAALKDFKASTMASRESLRTSHQDLREVEKAVRTSVSLSRSNSLRRSGGAGNTTNIPITLSNSLRDIIRDQREEGVNTDRTSLCVH